MLFWKNKIFYKIINKYLFNINLNINFLKNLIKNRKIRTKPYQKSLNGGRITKKTCLTILTH